MSKKILTVASLIKRLQGCPQDATVTLVVKFSRETAVSKATSVSRYHNEVEIWAEG